MRFVVVKPGVLALHRVRALLIRQRTALMNQKRGLLAGSGIVIAQGSALLRRAVGDACQFRTELSAWLGRTPRQHSSG
jgi:transposase